MVLLKQVKAEEIYDIRHKVLRKGEPFEEAKAEGDELSTTLHFAAVVDGKAVSCISLFMSANSDFTERPQGQLRFLATYPEYRGHGYGVSLFKLGEFHAFVKNNCQLVWLNSRIPYIGLYEKLGYSTHGEIFMLRDKLEHIVMKKSLCSYKTGCCGEGKK